MKASKQQALTPSNELSSLNTLRVPLAFFVGALTEDPINALALYNVTVKPFDDIPCILVGPRIVFRLDFLKNCSTSENGSCVAGKISWRCV